jgi:lysyl oxidase
LAVSLTAATMLTVIGTVPARAAAGTLKLFSPKSEVTITRHGDRPARLNTGVFVAAIGGDFEIHVTRPDYATEIGAAQYADGDWVQDLDPSMINGWRGLANFLHVKVKSSGGRVVVDEDMDICPGGWDIQRVNDDGPNVPRIPQFGCYAMPFTLGTIWGIDEGWASPVSSRYGFNDPIWIDGRDGEYHVTMSFPQNVVDTFGFDPDDSTVRVAVTLRTTRHGGTSGAPAWSGRAAPASSTGVPTDPHPDPSTVPDLIPLPAFNMFVDRGRDGSEHLVFGANVWNAGPSPLVVEGFRRSESDVMDAYQYFYDNGSPVSRAPAGMLLYDDRSGHHHWHFQQFAEYSLLNEDQTEVVLSEKESFCLAPTDAIDITRPGAELNPYSVGLYTACGGRDDIWIREVLDAGWGDTYFQYVAGQSFNIRGLPNGRYYVRVEANPTGELIEGDTSNNVSLRRVVIRGPRGHRYLVVPRYQLIDSEGCWYCGRYHP